MNLRNRVIITLGITLVLFCSTFSASQMLHSQTPFVYEESWALLLGVNSYKHLPQRLQLRFAVNDATSMRQLLIDHFGFRAENIITLTDAEATKSDIETAMQKLADVKKIGKTDRVLIYFSGHGQTVTLPDGTEMGFLIPHDAKIALADPTPNPADYYGTCIGMNRLRELSSFIPAKHVLFLIDACYSGLAVRSIRSLDPQLPAYLQKVTKLRARQIATAGLQGEQVYEERGHGIFTYKMLEALEHGLADQTPPDGVTTATELATYLSGIVPAYSENKQHPHFGRFDGEGEFVFQHRRTPNLTTPPNPSTLLIDLQRPTITILEPAGVQGSRPLIVEPLAKSVKLVGFATDNVGVTSVRVEGRLVPTTAFSRLKRDGGVVQIEKGVRFEATIDRASAETKAIEIQVTDAAGNSAVLYLTLQTQPPAPETPAVTLLSPELLFPKDMVLIPAGTFEMGIDESGVVFADGSTKQIAALSRKDASPRHTVHLDAFFIDKYEVTNAQYREFIEATGHRAPTYWSDSRFNAPNQPVVGVSWNDAMAYALWAKKRLPTEAEWEKAARGGLVKKQYPWGDGTLGPSKSNFADRNTDYQWSEKISDDGYQYTAPVGSFPPNGYGLYDMAGNVWEWCVDEYDADFYAKSPEQNPIGGGALAHLLLTVNRVLRGGSWLDSMYVQRAAHRSWMSPTHAESNIGFRCARSFSAR